MNLDRDWLVGCYGLDLTGHGFTTQSTVTRAATGENLSYALSVHTVLKVFVEIILLFEVFLHYVAIKPYKFFQTKEKGH